MIFTLNKLRNKLEKESVDIIERSYINHKVIKISNFL